MITKKIEIKKGDKIWIRYGGLELVKIVGVYQQEGAKLVKFKVFPWFGVYFLCKTKVFTLEEFLTKMVKSSD